MSNEGTRKYDSTVARIAGNVAAGLVGKPDRRCSELAESSEEVAEWAHSIVLLSVGIARAIVAEVERTEPKQEPS
jgi:hypothetical protein